jgi:hypothetical protein
MWETIVEKLFAAGVWGLVGVVAIAVLAAVVFILQQTSATYERFSEFKLKTCTDAARASAQIANSNETETLSMALRRFDELYYGELVLFESDELAKAMINFRLLLGDGENKDADIRCESVQERKAQHPDRFRQAALGISYACRSIVVPTLTSVITERLKLN